MLRSRFWDFFKRNPTGVSLTTTLSGNGSATAKIHYNGKIIVDLSNAQFGQTVILTTPLAFKVVDVVTIHNDNNQSTVIVGNAGSNITNTITMVLDKDIDRATEINDDNDDFAVGDDDLRLTIGTANAYARVIILVEYV